MSEQCQLEVLGDMMRKPYYLHLELTNLCNANCVFCGYQFQQRPIQTMSDTVFEKSLGDFLLEGGGSVTLTPIVGDALIDPQFLERVRRLRAEPHIDRIRLITNGILLDRFGIENVVTSGLDFLAISTPGFDQSTYERVFRSRSYNRMRDNVLELLACNERLGHPIQRIALFLRSDRPYEELMQSPDFQAVLRYRPAIHYSESYSSFVDRIEPGSLPDGMHLFAPPVQKHEACQKLFDSPIVLPDGTVLACDCYSAMDAIADLAIGNVLEHSLGSIWRGSKLERLRKAFANGTINETCRRCDNYQDLAMYRAPEGRERARLNRLRHEGGWEVRAPEPEGYWLNP
jgi:radical SAM protein with 4Fe4S-binding SPASM domain